MNVRKYLLIIAVLSLMSISFMSAQTPSYNLAEEPQVGMYSTSTMQGSGSTLPHAEVRNPYSAEQEEEIYKDRGGPNRTDDWPDIPFPDPIGDAAWPLALCALAYLISRVVRKRERVSTLNR